VSSSIHERIRELTAPMWRKKLFAVQWDGNGANLLPHLVAHLEYMISLEKAGKLFASGPLDFGACSDGLTVFNVASKEEARALAMQDPFVINGVRSFQIREWTVMEGSFGIQVNYSDRSIEIK
jgi:uncharacterized protein YciI